MSVAEVEKLAFELPPDDIFEKWRLASLSIPHSPAGVDLITWST